MLVFATYAIVLAPSLLLFGQLSDWFGRRIVIAGGLAAAIVGPVLFALARSTVWLFGARAAQGLAVGAISGTATAALVELEPSGDTRTAALPSGLAQAGGSGAGAIAAGAFAEWARAGAQAAGLGLLAAGLACLVAALPLHSLAVMIAGALLAGVGHGLGFLASQTDINELAPADRRGEVTSAFATCIYAGVATSVIGVGLLTLGFSLFASVAAFAAVIAALAVATAVWHVVANSS